MTGQPPSLATIESAVELRGVAKHYRDRQVLQSLDVTLQRGECLALLGHNGAGKTTLIKLICGLTQPSQGQILLHNKKLGEDKYWQRLIGYMPENAAFQGAMSGVEVLRFYARLKGCSRQHCDSLLEQVGLASAAKQRINTYSKGMRQRLLLAQALLGNPSVLLLDEPTSGLDPALRAEFYRLLQERLKAGVSVLIASHALAELEAKVDRVAILQSGVLLACATPDELRQQTDLPVRLTLSLSQQPEAREQVLTLCQGVELVNQNSNSQLEIVCHSSQKMALLRRFAQLDGVIEDIQIINPDLTQMYTHINELATKKEIQEQPQ